MFLPPHRLVLTGLASLALSLSLRAEDLIIDTFDTAGEVPQWPTDTYPAKPSNAWEKWWGDAIVDGVSLSFDSTVDVAGNANSGSMKVIADFDRLHGKEQYSIVKYLPSVPLDGSQYLTLEMDIKYKEGSVTRPDGTFGYLELGFATMDYAQLYATRLNIPGSASSEWFHISAPISASADKIDQLRGIHFKMWMGADTDPVGNSTFWVDNIKLIAPEVQVEPPIPTVRLEKAEPGLHLISSGPGIYDRQALRTTTPAYSWVGRTGPVTYSFTIQSYPGIAGYTSFLYLTPGENFAPGLNYVDYSAENCIVLFMNNNADGSGGMRLAYKDSAPNSNGQTGHDYWTNDDGSGHGGSLAYVNSSTVLGTWSLTFDSPTSATITSPDGQSASATLLESIAAKYANPMYAYFGSVPGDASRQGLTAVYSHIGITGTENPIDENFSEAPFTELLEKSASDANGILQVTAKDTPFFLKWSLPAVGYTLRQSADAGATGWQDMASGADVGALTVQGERWRPVTTFDLIDPKRGFFQLSKP